MTSERVVVAAGLSDPQPPHATTSAAVTAASRAGLITPNNTAQTLTSGQRGPAAPTDPPRRSAVYDSL
ncbi:hypothetical protein MOKP151_22840 [Mycobacterium avium subsp. hominissuis]